MGAAPKKTRGSAAKGALLWFYPLFIFLLTSLDMAPHQRLGIPRFVERLYPFLMSAAFWSLFFPLRKNPTGFLLAQAQKFRAFSTEEMQRLKQTHILWFLGLGANTAVLGYFLLYGRTVTWTLYASFYSYIVIFSLIAVTVLYTSTRLRSLLAYLRQPTEALLSVIHHSLNFAIFGLMCVLCISLLPVIYTVCFVVRGNYDSWIRKICFHSFRFVIFYTRLFRLIDMRIFGAERAAHAQLIVCNHLCMFDIVSIFGYFENCLTFVNQKFLYNPLLKPIIQSCGYIPLEPNQLASQINSYWQAAELLDAGAQLIVFPEGTRTRSGMMGPLQDGVFHLAITKQQDITPLFFTMNVPFLNKQGMYRKKLGCVQLYAYVMPPISTRGLASTPEGIRELKKSFQNAYAQFIKSPEALAWNSSAGIDERLLALEGVPA